MISKSNTTKQIGLSNIYNEINWTKEDCNRKDYVDDILKLYIYEQIYIYTCSFILENALIYVKIDMQSNTIFILLILLPP